MVMLAMIMTLIIVTIVTLHLILKFLTTHRGDTHLPTLMVVEMGMVEAEEEEEEEGDPPLNPEGKLLSLITIDSIHEGIACPVHLSHDTPHLVYWRQRRITALPCMSVYSH
jgi:hypothetical protein